MIYLFTSIIGVIAGFVSGFFGIGGGIIFVPALLFLFEAQGFSRGDAMLLATGTSLFAVVMSTLSGIQRHGKMKHIKFAPLWAILLGVIISSAFGVVLTNEIGGNALRYLLVAFNIWAITRMLKKAFSKKESESNESTTPVSSNEITFKMKSLLFLLGITVGIQSAMLGVGGGVLVVPVLIALLRYPASNAVGTSIFVAFTASLVAVIFRALLSSVSIVAPAGTIGTVNFPLALAIGIPAILGAQLGAIIHGKVGEVRWFYFVFVALLVLVSLKAIF